MLYVATDSESKYAGPGGLFRHSAIRRVVRRNELSVGLGTDAAVAAPSAKGAAQLTWPLKGEQQCVPRSCFDWSKIGPLAVGFFLILCIVRPTFALCSVSKLERIKPGGIATFGRRSTHYQYVNDE